MRTSNAQTNADSGLVNLDSSFVIEALALVQETIATIPIIL